MSRRDRLTAYSSRKVFVIIQELIALQTGGKGYCPMSSGDWIIGINVGARPDKVIRITLSRRYRVHQ